MHNQAKASISKRKPMTAATREANAKLAILWREARAKRLAVQKEEGYIVQQAPQGSEPEKNTHASQGNNRKALTILVRN